MRGLEAEGRILNEPLVLISVLCYTFAQNVVSLYSVLSIWLQILLAGVVHFYKKLDSVCPVQHK